MNETEKIIYLIMTAIQQAIDESCDLAPADLDCVKIKRAKDMFKVFSKKPEDFVIEDGIPIILVPFEKLRSMLAEMLPKDDNE